jgi:alpha-tubulin suppressor-like RCC1 family protein
MLRAVRHVAAFAAALALAACGGDSSSPPPPLVVDAERSTLAATPASAVADGVAAVTLTATALDASGTPVPGRVASFAVECAGCTLSSDTATTGADGTAAVTLTSTASGAKDVSVSIDGVAVAAHAEATFVAGPAASLAFTVEPTSAAAGEILTPVQVTVHDAFGNVVTSPTEITLGLTGGPGGVALLGTITGVASAGSADFTGLSVRTAGTGYALTASTDGAPGATSDPFAISAAAPDAAVSDVVADRTSLTVGAASALVATVRDAFGNAVPGATVSFVATGTANTLSPPADTDPSGVASATFSSTRAEAKTVTATVGALALADRPVVTFTPGAPDAWESSLVASRTSAPDDGTPVALTVTLRDAHRNPIAGETVTFSSSGRTTVTPPSAPTGADGTAAGSVSALEAGVQTLSALVGSMVVADAEVTFTVAPPSADQSTVAVAPASIPADGTTTATATITVRDGIGRPVAGGAVALSCSGPARFQPASATTDASGVATFALTSTSAGSGALVATVNPGAAQVVLADRPEVVFTTPVYAIGGVVSGLTADGLVLSTPGLPDVAVPTGATSFAFPVEVPSGTPYAVAVTGQPTLQRCSILNGSGTVGSGDVTGILVDCGATWKQVATGDRYTVGVKHDGSLYGWGSWTQASSISSLEVWPTATTAPVLMGTGFDSVSAGRIHTLALKADGSLYAWGRGFFGALGDGSTTDRATPFLVGTGFATASAGGYHSAAVKKDGTLWAWGDNSYGQLGDGTTTPRYFPRQVGTEATWASVSAGGYHTLALKKDGSLHAFGFNGSGQIGDGTGASKTRPVLVGTGYVFADAGDQHSGAVNADGELYMWGNNWYGQLGDGSSSIRYRPTLVGFGYASVYGGQYHTVAVKADGSLYAWGQGKLGDGSDSYSPTPVFLGTGFASAAAGYDHSAALRTDGSLYAWGRNDRGQRGDGSASERNTPAVVITGFTSVAAGQAHTLALKADGSLWAWGDNTYGQLGDGTTTETEAPVLVGTGFSSVAAGAVHSLGLKTDGTLWGWGHNGGRVGDGREWNQKVPCLVGPEFRSMDAGSDHSVGIKNDGSLWAWGLNGDGQLGDGTTNTRYAPVLVGSDYASVSAGGAGRLSGGHTLAVKTDGTLWAWGLNGKGQLGDGTTTSRSSPVLVGTDFASAAAGGAHSVAVKTDGSLWAWGDNLYGQLGDNSTTQRLLPVPVGSGSFVAVAAGAAHGAALESDGSLYAWGQNTHGQAAAGPVLGPPWTAEGLKPALLGTGFTTLSAGYATNLAIRADGSVWGWGLDDRSQLGDGLGDALTPRLVPDVAMPFGLRYAANPATYAQGLAITPNAPTSTGGPIASYAISPPLPHGLAFDPESGVVWGTPTGSSPTASHVVTATGPTGTATTALLTITVD